MIVALGRFVCMLIVFYFLAIICDEYFVDSLEKISNKLGLNDDVAGATLMAIGSSAPELFTAIIALITVGSEELGAGTIVGSALFNILVIVGASIVVVQGVLYHKPLIRDLLFYLLAICILYVTFQDGQIQLGEVILYIVAYGVYIGILTQWSGRFPMSKASQVSDEIHEVTSKEEKNSSLLQHIQAHVVQFLDALFPNLDKKPNAYRRTFFLSILRIAGLSWALVHSGVAFAQAVGLPEVLIALTILAGGTSVPDLLASLIVSRKGQGDMAISNAVGSNVFDIFIGLGLPWLAWILITGSPVEVEVAGLQASVLLLMVTIVILSVLLRINKFKTKTWIGRLLIAIYCGYLVFTGLTLA